jgi:hypothetical protein
MVDRVLGGILFFHACHWKPRRKDLWTLWRMQLRMLRLVAAVRPAKDEEWLDYFRHAAVEAKLLAAQARCRS